jgi:hypothetical protein
MPFISDGTGAVPTANIFQNSVSPPLFTATAGHEGYTAPRSPQNTASGRSKGNGEIHKPAKDFPKLPGFAPPVSLMHRRSALTTGSPIRNVRHHPLTVRTAESHSLSPLIPILILALGRILFSPTSGLPHRPDSSASSARKRRRSSRRHCQRRKWTGRLARRASQPESVRGRGQGGRGGRAGKKQEEEEGADR